MDKITDLGKIGITIEGEYDNNVIYEKLTIVLYKGKSYISTKTTQGIFPDEDILTWQLVAEAKDAYHMLVDAGKITLTEEEFLEQLVDATKGRYIVQGNIINAADEEDLTVEHSDLLGIDTLKFKNKEYNPLTYSGFGRKYLRKNMVNGVNTLTQSMINQSNTIYIIQYDFTLGENIAIPENCVLEFEGGSIIGDGVKTLTGNATNISSDTDNIFDNLVFAGTWHIVRIIANWFKGATDADMFNAAFAFAALTSTTEGISMYTGDEFNTVTCRPKSYNITKTMNIPQYVSFDGNGAIFRIAINFSGTTVDSSVGSLQFVFIVGHTYSNRGHNISIGNFNFDNIYEHKIGGLFIYNARYIHDIRSFRLNNLIIFDNNYIDQKFIERIQIEYTRQAVDYNNNNVADADIFIGLGDIAYLNSIVGCAIYMANQSLVKIQNIMPYYIYANNIDECIVDDIHTEHCGNIYVKGVSKLVIKNAYFLLNPDNNKKIIFDADILNAAKNGEAIFENCRFYNYNKSVSIDKDIFEGQPETLIFKNTYCIYNASGNRHIDGMCTRLKYKYIRDYNPGTNEAQYDYGYINDIYHVIKGSIISEDKTSFNNIKKIQKGKMSGGTEEGVVYIRRVYVLDTKRNIKANIVTIPLGTDYPDIIRANAGDNVYIINYEQGSSRIIGPEHISGITLRIELGKLVGSDVVYSKYLDIPLARYFTATQFKVVEDTNDSFGYKLETDFSTDTSKNIDYGDYIEANKYNKSEYNVEVAITSATAPSITNFIDYDKVILSKGKVLTKIGNNWVDTTGVTV